MPLRRWRASFLALAGLAALAAGSLGAVLLACLVDVDESLLDKADARSDAPAGADASPEASADGAAQEAGTPDAYAGMPCGAGHCLPPDQVCCTATFSNPDRRLGSCSHAADCETGDYWECMTPLDCAHAGRPPVCCANQFSGGGFSKALCQTSCAANATILCDPSAPSCTPPASCLPSPTFVDQYECR